MAVVTSGAVGGQELGIAPGHTVRSGAKQVFAAVGQVQLMVYARLFANIAIIAPKYWRPKNSATTSITKICKIVLRGCCWTA